MGQLQDLKGPMGVTLTDVGLVVVDTAGPSDGRDIPATAKWGGVKLRISLAFSGGP